MEISASSFQAVCFLRRDPSVLETALEGRGNIWSVVCLGQFPGIRNMSEPREAGDCALLFAKPTTRGGDFCMAHPS